MTDRVDRELLAERAAAVVQHLDRVAEHLPADPDDLRPLTSATDTVVLHLWQAVQVVIDPFRNLVVHGYGRLDLRRVHAVASAGPADLRAFLAALRDRAE